MCFFFFKQKTAYEMRISDWSSDVCSSDLAEPARVVHLRDQAAVGDARRDAVAEFTGGRVVLQQRLERGEAFGHPVPRQDLAPGLGHAPVARQVLHYPQVVERVDRKGVG